ncbi:MAG TPA: class I SAM-dependent methyltransferase [Vicinamibacterales bacterium]|nr:class I SAM-dependent methyltransferase [Vicinamibacterales bacterium]
MAFTLNLPYTVCYPVTRLARRRLRTPATALEDQAVYFEEQYSDTNQRYYIHMRDLDLAGKRVLDIGSGLGGRALGWLDLGATHVTNVDINRQELEAGQAILHERYPNRASQIRYRHPDDMADVNDADVAILFDAFEHLVEPDVVLRQVHGWLRPGGMLWVGSIGWYNYLASHCTGWHIPIPWCQVLFSETAIIRTIRTLLRSPGYTATVWERMEGLGRWDSVTTLRDRPGEPLNMLSLRKIRRVMRASPFQLREFRVYGFSGKANPLAPVLSPLAKVPVLQELFHSYYSALLVKP